MFLWFSQLPPGHPLSMFVCAVANNGWISIVKVSIGAYGYSASRMVPKDPKNPLRFFLSHFIWLPQEAYWEVGEGAEGPLSWVHMSLGTRRVPQLSAGARRRVAVGHPNLLIAKIWIKYTYCQDVNIIYILP